MTRTRGHRELSRTTFGFVAGFEGRGQRWRKGVAAFGEADGLNNLNILPKSDFHFCRQDDNKGKLDTSKLFCRCRKRWE